MNYEALGRYTELEGQIRKIVREQDDKVREIQLEVQLLDVSAYVEFDLSSLDKLTHELRQINLTLVAKAREANIQAGLVGKPLYEISKHAVLKDRLLKRA